MQHAPPVRSRPDWLGFGVVGLVLVGLALLGVNILFNMQAAGMTPGFGFLAQTAGFDLSESMIPYTPAASYARAIAAGVVNTLLLALACLALATTIGIAMGLVSVAPSPPGRVVATLFVELFRNLPKILVLLVIYVMAVRILPPVRDAISIGPVYLSNRSLYFPTIQPDASQIWLLLPLSAAVIMSLWWRHRASLHKQVTGQEWPVVPVALALLAGLPFIFTALTGVSLTLSYPEIERFDFTGGGRLSLQFLTVLLTLGLYHGAQIAEVVRGGIQAVPAGQVEAARALGLSPWTVTRLVVLPQVLRIVIPPMINQYVNLIKNTSIAIAVGYSDLMSVSGTIINQTFRPLEMMLLTMGLYLGLCLLASSLLNRLNDRLQSQARRAQP